MSFGGNFAGRKRGEIGPPDADAFSPILISHRSSFLARGGKIR